MSAVSVTVAGYLDFQAMADRVSSKRKVWRIDAGLEAEEWTSPRAETAGSRHVAHARRLLSAFVKGWLPPLRFFTRPPSCSD